MNDETPQPQAINYKELSIYYRNGKRARRYERQCYGNSGRCAIPFLGIAAKADNGTTPEKHRERIKA